MSYVQTVLQPEEKILAIGRLHWIVYARGAVTAVVGLVIPGIAGPDGFGAVLRVIAWLVLLAAVVLLAEAWFRQWTTEIAVTNRRVIQKRGFIRRSTNEMNMDKVESVIVDQSLLGRLLDYGSVGVRGTGSGIDVLDYIAKPIALRSAIVVR